MSNLILVSNIMEFSILSWLYGYHIFNLTIFLPIFMSFWLIWLRHKSTANCTWCVRMWKYEWQWLYSKKSFHIDYIRFVIPKKKYQVSFVVSSKRQVGLETPEHGDVHRVLPVEAGSCITSVPHTKLVVYYYVGLIHFAANVIRWADDHQLNKKEKTG